MVELGNGNVVEFGNGHMVDLGINSFWTNQEWNPQEILIFSAVLEDPKLVLSSHIL